MLAATGTAGVSPLDAWRGARRQSQRPGLRRAAAKSTLGAEAAAQRRPLPGGRVRLAAASAMQ